MQKKMMASDTKMSVCQKTKKHINQKFPFASQSAEKKKNVKKTFDNEF